MNEKDEMIWIEEAKSIDEEDLAKLKELMEEQRQRVAENFSRANNKMESKPPCRDD